ncbi:tetratricopeptide repeat protein [Pontimicrobium sp. SW4]|uniref:Tetratricopeptide repeat protein n=1 Tax=Pontimicrobium sp. SW4 TaxID=3153519 RepID=A0AAU7BT23_9FLAO
MARKIGYILTFLLSISLSAQNDVLFDAGNKSYNEGNYQEAIESYERILSNDVHSSELYFNLGNAYYKLNRIAPSIYYYEKALQLSPKNKDIKANLSFAQNMTIDDIEVVPEIGLSRISKNIINTFSFDTWALFSIGLVMVFAILFLGYYFSSATTKKRLAFVISSSAIILSMVCLFFAYQKYQYVQKDKPAIVFAKETDIKIDPNLRSEVAFTLHEGTKVQVLERYDENWVKIKLADGKTGWIPFEDIKLLNNI